MLPRNQIFDAIYHDHSKKGHLAAVPTYNQLAQTYANITLQQVKEFRKLCPICNTQNPAIQPTKGARNPITTESFRDRGQIDLVDMRKRRKRDINGVMMRWLISFKDHLTGFCAFGALPFKKQKYVVHWVSWLFGLIGFPLIFHTDNGKEFVSKLILSMLKALSPSTSTVTGRPRNPRDQGSVENVNKVAK